MEAQGRAPVHEDAFGPEGMRDAANSGEPAALPLGVLAGRNAALLDGAASTDSFQAVSRAGKPRSAAMPALPPVLLLLSLPVLT